MTNLCRVGYIVAVHHPVALNAEPPRGLACPIAGRENPSPLPHQQHWVHSRWPGVLHPGAQQHHLVMTHLPGQAGGDGEHTDG
jgi:hypothetical protein